MGVVTGPLFSLGASGTIAKTLTYSTWRGVKYARERVIPANPRSAAQTVERNTFTQLNQLFVLAPTNALATWTEDARGRPYTARNRFIGRNLPVIDGLANIAGLFGIEPRGLAPAPTGVVLSDGGVLLASFVSDTPPNLAGVAFTRVLGVAIRDFDPGSAEVPASWVEGTDVAGPISFTVAVPVADDYLLQLAWQWTIGGFIVTSVSAPAIVAIA